MFSRRVILAGVGALLLTACAAAPRGPDGQALEPLSITTSTGDHRFMVEIADDDAERQRGLMERPPLAEDRGMLFQFPDVQERGFWMHNTPSSLDIIYIDPRGKIVSIVKRAAPENDTVLPSHGPASGVLELRAGRSDEIGAKPGDTVHHPFFAN